MTTATQKNQVTCTEFAWRHEIVTADIFATFYVAAAREDGTGRWKLLKVHGKSFSVTLGPFAMDEFSFDLFTHRQLFKRAVAEKDGAIKDAALIAALDAQERADEANGVCRVPC